MNGLIMDAGPLVAWFCPRDEHYEWAGLTFSKLQPGGIICEAVITEVCHLVAKEGVARNEVIEFVIQSGLETVALGNDLPAIARLLTRYADAPMDFADACMVRLAEMYPDATVCTTDGHFKFFRRNQHDVIPLLAPFPA